MPPSPRWCEQALTEAGDDPLLQARCHATFAETCPSGAKLDLWHADQAVALLGRWPTHRRICWRTR